MECPATINKTICVETNVKVDSDVDIGDVKSYCVGRPRIEMCYDNEKPHGYMVNQMVCVRFPLLYSTNATARTYGICDVKGCNELQHTEVCRKPDYNRRRNRNLIIKIVAIFFGFKIFKM